MLTRILVHAEAQPEESDGPIRLQRWDAKPVKVLEMSPPVWWITEPDGTPQPVNPRNVRVCAGLECTVAACTRAETLRAVQAEEDVFRRNRDAQIGGMPLNERERAAVLQLHRDDEVGIYNLGYSLERLGMKPPAGDPAAIMEHVHALALELKSRREEQGLLRDHPSDPPGNRIRYWMEARYPGEREAAQQFSAWVISKLELYKSLQEQVDRLATYIMDEVPGEPSQNDGAIDTAIRIMREQRAQIELRKEVQSAQLGPIMLAVDRLFGEDIKAVMDGKGWEGVGTAIPAILEHVAGRLPKLDPA